MVNSYNNNLYELFYLFQIFCNLKKVKKNKKNILFTNLPKENK